MLFVRVGIAEVAVVAVLVLALIVIPALLAFRSHRSGKRRGD